MRRRLRKKKHQGEFTEWGCQIIITRKTKDGFDEFLDSFIEEAVEANDCYCGGGGAADRLDMILELGRRSDDPATRLSAIAAWLEKRPDVLDNRTGELFDLWNGSYEEMVDTRV